MTADDTAPAEVIDVLVIDDEPEFCAVVESVAELAGLACRCVTSSADFTPELLDRARVVVLDLSMPGMTGPAIMAEMGRRGSSAAVILMSGFDAGILEASAAQGRRRGANVVTALAKPVMASDLLGVIRDAVQA